MKKISVCKTFEHVAELFPERMAIEDMKLNLTYRKLDQYSSQLAGVLKAYGISNGRIVGIYLDSSISYIVAILGVMKADAIFMPINTGFPPHRLSSVLNKVRPDAFITHVKRERDFLNKLNHPDITCGEGNIFVVDEQMTFSKKTHGTSGLPQNSDSYNSLEISNITDDACYIITTSGSTGEPKAILGSSKGLAHFISWERNEFDLNETTRCTQLSPVTFDVSLRDIFVPLTSGGTLCIPDEDTKRSPDKLAMWMAKSEITLTHIVPTLFRMLTRELARYNGDGVVLPTLKHALIAGEMLFGNDVDNWRSAVGNHVDLVNLYGPSETTLAKLFFRIRDNGFEPRDAIPVGKPLPDTEVKVVKDGASCAPGERGEVYIKTPYMSNGYYNASELNKRSFVIDPVAGERDASVIYKTGDIGRFLPDGNLQLTGRIDGQLKLHGKRIEIGEIEVVLMRHPDIKSAAVSVISDGEGNRRLAGYIVPEDEAVVAVDTLRVFVKKDLPEYMIPNVFVRLKSLPLTHNGKVDRKALPAPAQTRPDLTQNYKPPSTPMEKTLANVWGDLLFIHGVGVHDNFFDLGGNSILSVQLIEMMRKKIQINIDVVDLFQYPTIRKLAEYLSKDKGGPVSLSVVQSRGKRRQDSVRRRIRPDVQS